RPIVALGLLLLAGCSSGTNTGLTRASGTSSTSTSTSPSTSASTTSTSTAAAAVATTTAQSTVPGPAVVRYRIERHTNDDATADFASVVTATLNDPRGWTRAGFVFQEADDA